MKKTIALATLLCVVLATTAQQNPTPQKPQNNTQQKNKQQRNNNEGTTNTGTRNPGDTTGTRGQTGMNQDNNTNIEGSMTSTGRYAAMGVRTGNLHRKDAKFVVLAASSNNLELQLSQLAQQRATNQAVKDFAAMMVEHHTMAAQEMKSLLSAKGASVPDTALLPMHRLQMESVTAAQGADFDKAYMRIMVDAHEEDVDEYEDETTDARDADIRAFATRMLPTLQTHYARAKEVRGQVK
jgi:putative membrane protein